MLRNLHADTNLSNYENENMKTKKPSSPAHCSALSASGCNNKFLIKMRKVYIPSRDNRNIFHQLKLAMVISDNMARM